jgi:hypothetical protein
MIFKEMTDNQRRVFIDTIQLYEAFLSAFNKNRSYRGGMHWKKSKGREYLFRSRDRFGYGKSLGPRSPETEKILVQFQQGKQREKERLSALQDQLKEQSRFCKAALIQRVPRIVCSILRLLDQQNILGRNVMVIGTNAMYAYEAAAGVFFDISTMATKDMDILWDIRPKLILVADKDMDNTGFLGIIRKADRSFESISPGGFRAVNRDGFMVDLIKSEPKQLLSKEARRMGGPDDLEAAEIRNLQWLISSPKFSQVVIGEDGYPASLVVPDPRAFALHKLWLSEQADREPVKKQRDHDQGLAVAQLIIQYLPQYQFNTSELRMFPKDVVQKAKEKISDIALPVGIDLKENKSPNQ